MPFSFDYNVSRLKRYNKKSLQKHSSILLKWHSKQQTPVNCYRIKQTIKLIEKKNYKWL